MQGVPTAAHFDRLRAVLSAYPNGRTITTTGVVAEMGDLAKHAVARWDPSFWRCVANVFDSFAISERRPCRLRRFAATDHALLDRVGPVDAGLLRLCQRRSARSKLLTADKGLVNHCRRLQIEVVVLTDLPLSGSGRAS